MITFSGRELLLPMVHHIDGFVFIMQELVTHLFDMGLLQEDVNKCFLVVVSGILRCVGMLTWKIWHVVLDHIYVMYCHACEVYMEFNLCYIVVGTSRVYIFLFMSCITICMMHVVLGCFTWLSCNEFVGLFFSIYVMLTHGLNG